jgi:hypothetical protein
VVCLYEHFYWCSFFGYSTFFESWGNGSTLLLVTSKLLTRCYQTVNLDLDIPSLPPTVDTSSTRGDWVSSYKYNNFEWGRPGHWVYFRDNTVSIELFLTSSRLPSGPGFSTSKLSTRDSMHILWWCMIQIHGFIPVSLQSSDSLGCEKMMGSGRMW